MAIATGTAIALAAGLGAAGSLGSAALASRGAQNAANTQKASGDAAIDLQREIFNRQQGNLDPYRYTGQMGLNTMNFGMGPGGVFGNLYTDQPGALQPYGERDPNAFRPYGEINPGAYRPYGEIDPTSMRAPTMEDITIDPGFQFRLGQGVSAVENSAAGKGLLKSGKTLKDITRFGQELASNEYGNAFQRFQQDRGNRFGIYSGDRGQRFDMFQGDTTNRFNRDQTDRGNRFNMATTDLNNLFNRTNVLANLGMGATSDANLSAGQFGQQAGETMMGIGNAQAAGQVGSANAWAGAAGNASATIQQLLMMQAMGLGGGSRQPSFPGMTPPTFDPGNRAFTF